MPLPLKLVPDATNIRFLRWRNVAISISLALILASLVLVAVRQFNYGVDFVGGQMVRVTFVKSVPIDTLRAEVASLGLGDAAIQQSGGPDTVTIRLQKQSNAEGTSNAAVVKLKQGLTARHPGVTYGQVESVDGKVSRELLKTGALSLLLAMLGISLYIWFRFEWQFGVGALFALFHDIALTLGFFALTRLEFNLNVIAALLTIIGYSLNDTIIVYDRIRENLRKYRKMDMEALLDLSVNETLSRTMVTSLSLILTLTILLVLGPPVIFGFTAAMLLGVFIGTFSSVYVSAPILIWLKVRSDSFLPREGKSGDAERTTRRNEGLTKAPRG